MDNQDHASLQSALVQSCLALSSDPDMLDYMAAITAEELSSFDAANKQSRSAAVAALQEALGIFLLDGGLVNSEQEVRLVCESVMNIVHPVAAGVELQGDTNDKEQAPTAPQEESAPKIETAAETSTPPSRSQTLLAASTPSPSGVHADGIGSVRQPRPNERAAVEAIFLCALRAAGCEVDKLDSDLVLYMVECVCEDPEERDLTLEDMLVVCLVESGAAVSEADALSVCADVRARLDEAGAAPSSTLHVSSDPRAGFRKLKQAVHMGHGEVEEAARRMNEISIMGGLQAELSRQQREQADRLEAAMARNQEAAQSKRLIKEKKDREKARKALAQAEALAAELLEVSSAPQRRRLGECAVDVHVQEFSLPSPSGGADLLASAQLRLIHGRRYGLCGKNGAGKSTLLRLVALRKIIGIPANLNVLYVAQDTADKISTGDSSALDAVVASDVHRTQLLALKEKLEAETSKHEAPSDQLSDVYESLEVIGAATAHERAAGVLRGLQFSADMMGAPVAALSGGWRMRVALAQALFQEPDVLLLDEPTNHLDLEAVLWLETRLQGWGERTLVVVSHDRTFLNEVCTDIIHFHQNKLEYYAGDYNTFEAVREEQKQRQQRQFQVQETKKKELQKYVDKHLHKGSSLSRDDAGARQAKAKAKQIERIGVLGTDGKRYKLSYDGPQQAAEAIEEESTIRLQFPDPGKIHSGKDMLQLNDVHFRYPEARGVCKGSGDNIFCGISMGIDLRARMGLVGANGAGKSTLLKLLLGNLQPTKGEIQRSRHFRIAAFTQHHMDQLDLSLSPLEYMFNMAKETEPDITVDEVRRRIGKFKITGGFQTQRMELLSGGQKSRVAFCKATWHMPHLLLLDEPTNHLDIETVDALIDAVNNFKGGVLTVSHDQHFIQSTCSELWIVAKAHKTGLYRFDGSFEDYKKSVLKQA